MTQAQDQNILELRAMTASLTQYAPVTSFLLSRVTDDIEEHGRISRAIADHPNATASLSGIRILAGVRWLILAGRAPELGDLLHRMQDSRDWCVHAHRAWELVTRAVLEHPEEIRNALDRPVQQHHPSRAAQLLEALGILSASRVRLLELGSCAGLNLLVDRYRWFGPGWEWGDRHSAVRLATPGRMPGELQIVERAGCDLAPRDPSSPADTMILHSFLPPEREIDQMELDDALALAAEERPRVDRADAAAWLANELAQAPSDPSVYTVVWHSFFWCYLSAQQQHEIEGILSSAAQRMSLARAACEPHAWTLPPRLQLTVYS
ncbi:DUF2332 domain-containing protein [Streptomyces sp. NBC_00271]|uniref:DUF2332 domain-containing protein n=1 Tax=Streptomyces sp. NBC_00271 TaxID=2975697 RepID=UPI002E2A9B5D|nr:DUF2332 domain-containing protein [Streptomyces sp. NBC_00271]